MVTEAGKELLRNTINTAKFHNRILEENEMWKQFELERGLTMMVSDDLILKRNRKQHMCSRHRRSKSKSVERVVNRDTSAAGSSNQLDRWDHNGFRELYPEESDSTPSTSTIKKWDHSGFLELYPEEAVNMMNTNSKTKEEKSKEIKKQKKKKRKHTEVSTSDSEIWEEFKMYKRKSGKKSKEKPESRSVKYDTHVKEWRKQSRNDAKFSHT